MIPINSESRHTMNTFQFKCYKSYFDAYRMRLDKIRSALSIENRGRSDDNWTRRATVVATVIDWEKTKNPVRIKCATRQWHILSAVCMHGERERESLKLELNCVVRAAWLQKTYTIERSQYATHIWPPHTI